VEDAAVASRLATGVALLALALVVLVLLWRGLAS